MRGLRTVMKSGPHLLQLEKALAQKRRPNTAKTKKQKTKKQKTKTKGAWVRPWSLSSYVTDNVFEIAIFEGDAL